MSTSKNLRGKKSSLLDPAPPGTKEADLEAAISDPDETSMDPVGELRQMFDQLLLATSAQGDRIHNEVLEIKSIQAHQRDEVSDLKTSLIQLSAASSPDSTSYRPIITPKKSSFFFGTPDIESRPPIQVLQSDIVYEKELKVSSLEGMQYLAKQIQILSSKYPGRDLKLSHMVSYSLRPHVVAAWNSYCHQEAVITGLEPEEILVENWLSLSNDSVQAILIEAARPRTRELYSRDLVLFLGKGIPQSPPMSTDNFSKIFYAPLMKSLNDLIQLHDLLSEETSKFSNNKAKMPPTGYGTKESPGHIALWLISLGSQKDSVMQWLGKDNLTKYKTLDPAVKFVRAKLMEGRSHSEIRQDFDAKLTPIRYDDIRHTQGETNTRFQTPSYVHQVSSYEPTRARQMPIRTGFSAIDLRPSSFNIPYDNQDVLSDNEVDEDNEDFMNKETCEIPVRSGDSPSGSPLQVPEDIPDDELDTTFAAITDNPSARSAIAATFRGYCSELFVYGKCNRRDHGCTLDHSSAGQERCIQSFNLLMKRELVAHSQLPPWNTIKPNQSAVVVPRPTISASRYDQRPDTRNQRTPSSNSVLNRHSNSSAPYRSSFK